MNYIYRSGVSKDRRGLYKTMPGTIPKDKYININTVCSDIDKCIDKFLNDNGIEKDYKSLMSIKHSTVNYMLTFIYKSLFKPNQTLCNNQKTYVDLENIELLQVLADKFIEICQRFNKSLGLMSFGYMIGVNYNTLTRWVNDEKSNSKRYCVIKSIQESHKAQHIALLNESPVGALAVANNDVETGLEWSTKQALTAQNNAVFLIPSERLQRLSITDTKSIVQNAE